MQMETSKKVYGLAGLPATGKTTAAMIMAGESDGSIVRGGQIIREQAQEHGISDPTSAELGRFAAEQRELHGSGFFGKLIQPRIEHAEDDYFPVVVDSFRHRNGIAYIEDLDVDFETIWFACPRQVRLKRIQTRGRDDEGSFTIEDLRLRDQREMRDLGVDSLVGYEFDHEIQNNMGKQHLYQRLMEIIES